MCVIVKHIVMSVPEVPLEATEGTRPLGVLLHMIVSEHVDARNQTSIYLFSPPFSSVDTGSYHVALPWNLLCRLGSPQTQADERTILMLTVAIL